MFFAKTSESPSYKIELSVSLIEVGIHIEFVVHEESKIFVAIDSRKTKKIFKVVGESSPERHDSTLIGVDLHVR
jgi:hypothetical protein